jgi:heat shock protein HslJ
MLRNKLGEDVFWQAIRAYYHDYKESTASTDDFKKVLEKVSGKDLTLFFKQWLYGEGQPVLAGEWQYAKGIVTITINQTQANVFEFPLEVGLVYGNKTIIKTVNITSAKASFGFDVEEPEKVIIDPNINLLFEGISELKKTATTNKVTSRITLNNKWMLIELNEEQIDSPTLPTMELNIIDNKVSGNGGCNNYHGGARVKGKKLLFDENMISTRMMCGNSAMEDAFFKLLTGGKFNYKISNNRLTLIKKGDPVMVFRKID